MRLRPFPVSWCLQDSGSRGSPDMAGPDATACVLSAPTGIGRKEKAVVVPRRKLLTSHGAAVAVGVERVRGAGHGGSGSVGVTWPTVWAPGREGNTGGAQPALS